MPWTSTGGGGGSSPTGPASGDLGASYPNPTVVGVRGIPVPFPSVVGSTLTLTAPGVLSWVSSAPGAQPQLFTAPMASAITQVAYQSAPGALDLADASNAAKMPVLGFIAAKPTTTSAYLQDHGELGGFVGLIAGSVYFADPATPGGITDTKPSGAAQVAQQVGIAKTVTVMTITLSLEPPEYLP